MNTQTRDTVLVVVRIPEIRAELRDILGRRYHLLEAGSASQTIALLRLHRRRIAAILLDLDMADADGQGLPELLRTNAPTPHIPLVALSGTGGQEAELQALRRGALDVFSPPFCPELLRRRLHNLVELHRQNCALEERLDEQSHVLRHSNERMVDALSSIIEHRSLESGSHVLRIRGFTRILLDQVSSVHPEYELDESSIDTIVSASTLHDVGKISVPDSILHKPGRLTAGEFEQMKAHTTAGAAMLETLQGIGAPEYLYYAYNICRYHHERWDGRGYPDGLKGDDIPLCAQVVGVADVYDALTTARSYKPAFPHHQAMNMILNGECGLFNPVLLECLEAVSDQFEELARSYADHGPSLCDHSEEPREQHSAPVSLREPDPHQLAQVKYQAMLRYADDMVVEIDVRRRLYHIVYNPDPHLIPPLASSSLSEFLLSMAGDRVHPGDYDAVNHISEEGICRFFQRSLRKLSTRYRLFHPDLGDYVPYVVTFHRLELNDPDQQRFLAIWHRVEPAAQPGESFGRAIPGDVVHALTSSLIRLRADHQCTLLDGVQNLSHLTGFTPGEIAAHFHNSLLELVIPEEREDFHRQLTAQLEQGRRASWEHRLLRKNGLPLRVLHQTHLATDSDGLESLYSTLVDTTGQQRPQEDGQPGPNEPIVFEWNIPQRTLICSEHWEQVFGTPRPTFTSGEEPPFANHIHPDDLARLRHRLDWASIREAWLDAEVRILSSDGYYLRCQLQATILRDDGGLPVRLVGALCCTDPLHSPDSSQHPARDALTHLLNRTSIRRQVDAILRERLGSGHPSALLLLDLDHFRRINHSCGHLFGDELLSQTALELRRLFGPQDIIGRIGGDELMVYMDHAPTLQLVEQLCQRINDTCRSLFRAHATELPISCSIGAALSPLHGSTYAELFQRAGQALYRAKRQGRDCYVIYDPDTVADLEAPAPVGSDIDSDHRLGLAGDSIVRYVFRRLYEAGDLSRAIHDSLSTIGRQMHASRVYIFEHNRDNTHCSNTFEWCREGVAPQRARLQQLSLADDLPSLSHLYDHRGLFHCPDVSQLPPDLQSILAPRGVRSLLHCAIWDQGAVRGFVGFDDMAHHRLWTPEQLDLLHFLAQVISLFLLKQRAQEALTASAPIL